MDSSAQIARAHRPLRSGAHWRPSECATLRRLARVVESGELERAGIQHRPVAGDVHHKHWIVGYHLVEIPSGEQLALEHFAVVVATGADPCVGVRQTDGGSRQGREDVGIGMDDVGGNVGVEEVLGRLRRMHVGVVEAGDDGRVAEIDALGERKLLLQLITEADGGDVLADGDQRVGALISQGDDVARGEQARAWSNTG